MTEELILSQFSEDGIHLEHLPISLLHSSVATNILKSAGTRVLFYEKT